MHPGDQTQPVDAREETTAGSVGEVGREATVVDAILDAESAEAGREVLVSYLRQGVMRVLEVPESRLDSDVGLTRLGLDSLMAVELRNHLEFDLSLTVPVVKLLEGPTIRELAAWLYGEIEKAAQALDRLSDSEVEEKLLSSEDALGKNSVG